MRPDRQPPLPPPRPPPQHQHHNPSNPSSPEVFSFHTPPNRQPTPSPAFLKFYTPPRTPFAGKRKPSGGESSSTPAIILRDSHHRTHPGVWCGAFVCLAFSLLLILFGISTLVVFLVIKPRYPTFDVASANLKAIYFDSPEYLNGDFSFVANFTNPNERMDVRFEGVDLELAFSGRAIAAGSVEEGFELRKKGEMKAGTVRMVSSLVYLPLKVALELQQKVERNRVEYELRGRFRVRAHLAGGIGFSYWLRSACFLQMTAPPTGVLVARRCTTRR